MNVYGILIYIPKVYTKKGTFCDLIELIKPIKYSN